MKERAAVAAVLGSLVVIIVVIVVVLAFGRPHPSPDSLEDDPQAVIPGEILYLSTDGCVIAAEASGASRRELTCPVDAVGVGWLEDGSLTYSTFSRTYDWWQFDPSTGETTRIESELPPYEVFGPPDFVSPNDERAAFDSDGSLVVLDPEPRRVFEYKGPSGYIPGFVTWSPDGEWLLLFYARGEELWVIARDGSIAGTLAGDVQFSSGIASWRIPDVGIRPEITPPAGR